MINKAPLVPDLYGRKVQDQPSPFNGRADRSAGEYENPQDKRADLLRTQQRFLKVRFTTKPDNPSASSVSVIGSGISAFSKV